MSERNPTDPVVARDEDTAARVISDIPDPRPGGGGLGGASAAGAAQGDPAKLGGRTRNAPIDVPGEPAGDTDVERDARIAAGRAGPKEPHPSSQ